MTKNTTDLAVVKTELQYIKKIIEEGFTGVHKRQDAANGKLVKHEEKLASLDIKVVEICDDLRDKVSKVDYDANVLSNVKDVSGFKTKVIYGALGGGWTIAVAIITIYLPKLVGG